MNAEQLYHALVDSNKPITPARLEKAQARADSPSVYDAVLARLRAEGFVKD